MHILRAIPPVWDEVKIEHKEGSSYLIHYTYAPNLGLPSKGVLKLDVKDNLAPIDPFPKWELRIIDHCGNQRILAWVPPLSPLEKRIIVTLQRHWRWYEGGSSWYNFEKLAEEVNRPLKEVKLATRALAKKNVVRLTYLYNSDYMLGGRGYILNDPYERQR